MHFPNGHLSVELSVVFFLCPIVNTSPADVSLVLWVFALFSFYASSTEKAVTQTHIVLK